MNAPYSQHGRAALLARIAELEKRQSESAERHESDLRGARRDFAWRVIAYMQENFDIGDSPSAEDRFADCMSHIRTMADPDW